MLSIPLVASGAAGVALHVCDAMGGVLVGDWTQPCCTVKLSSASQLVATQEVSSQQVDEAAVAVVASAGASVASSRELCDPGLVRERAPPNVHGPPLFIRNCSFLN